MRDAGITFFDSLFASSIQLIASFPITLEPAQMGYITGTLEPLVREARAGHPFVDPTAETAAARRDDVAVGMNTTGMLLDRLSILAMKHWNLEHRARSPEKARALATGQVAELIEALAQARPGQSSINNKMTNRQVDARAERFADAYCGLVTTNMLLWEAQEILYNHDIMALPAEELRAYIEFFSRGNIERNVYIQASDTTYWAAAGTA
jgi:hypothetical protein